MEENQKEIQEEQKTTSESDNSKKELETDWKSKYEELLQAQNESNKKLELEKKIKESGISEQYQPLVSKFAGNLENFDNELETLKKDFPYLVSQNKDTNFKDSLNVKDINSKEDTTNIDTRKLGLVG